MDQQAQQQMEQMLYQKYQECYDVNRNSIDSFENCVKNLTDNLQRVQQKVETRMLYYQLEGRQMVQEGYSEKQIQEELEPKIRDLQGLINKELGFQLMI